MRPPCEIVQREFLPTVRTRLAQSLKMKGLSQMEISSKLDVTQAAVSKYLNQPSCETELSQEITELVERLTDMIQNPTTKADMIVKELCSACMFSRLGSALCRVHQNNVNSLKAVNCQICSQLIGGNDDSLSERAIVLSEMQDALRILEDSPSFERIVPQVRANLVACTLEAKSIDDVAGVPGRITIINNHAVVLVGPQFGASRHTAELLLNARNIWPKVRACLCVSGQPEVVNASSKAGFNVISIAYSESDASKIVDSLRSMTKRASKAFRYPAIHVQGGFGVEPILYLFGETATQLSHSCLKISDMIVSKP
jgi:predicted fused transcriptional regulator/phosphomethylpyrimidine kinase/predicted transcriptional regulator